MNFSKLLGSEIKVSRSEEEARQLFLHGIVKYTDLSRKEKVASAPSYSGSRGDYLCIEKGKYYLHSHSPLFFTLVYFLYDKKNNRMKIGMTTKLNDRIKAIEQSTGLELTLLGLALGPKKLEKGFHWFFEEDRISYEWFAFNEEKFNAIKDQLVTLEDAQDNNFKIWSGYKAK